VVNNNKKEIKISDIKSKREKKIKKIKIKIKRKMNLLN